MRLQKEKIINVIKHDATDCGYYCRNGQYCVIGGLLKAAGCDVETVIPPWENSTHIHNLNHDVRALLKSAYGLSLESAYELQQINDRNLLITKRREELIKYVNEL